jgi:hypothetical protein
MDSALQNGVVLAKLVKAFDASIVKKIFDVRLCFNVFPNISERI